ncbi:hypothetical protein G1H10_19610 [Phytoactinopolyspora halotolerans]|uniref:Uncharacterized protein n=2 Tax=Phytoactinopolyspora halotolerans TaxID=1981512 RepID=A0A6L9SAJ3_9ACTN|nr:hypothetical protein [Phytoactinopolyspora halotolerans]
MATLDGAWWPRSRDLAAELPELIATLSQRGFTVARVAYHRDSWDSVSGKLPIAGRVVRLGWFRTIDAHLLSLTELRSADRLDLLVIPPTSDPLLAEQAFAWIQDGHHDGRATAFLTDADTASRPSSALSGVHAGRVAENAWESEGGSYPRPNMNNGDLHEPNLAQLGS